MMHEEIRARLSPEQIIANAEALDESMLDDLRRDAQRGFERAEKRQKRKGRVLGMGILAVIGFIVWFLLR